VDLLTISYSNIWPFKWKLKNIFFKKWKYLIKAPIWSGKSFLFFDWPVYALYKYSSRNILNTDSKNWFIKLLFEQDEQKYLIIRNLEQGKAKDICKSQLFTVDWNFEFDDTEILNGWGKDIQELLAEKWLKLDEIVFKNETDLDWTLKWYLPPKEVFLSTVFLLQDSENIFELQPADRLTVMKNIFNLVWIDDVKDQIADKKKEIQTTLKIKSDTTLFDSKIKVSLNNYIRDFRNIENSGTVKISSETSDFLNELEMIAEKVNINDFSMEWFDMELSGKVESKIAEKMKDYQWFLLNLQNTEKSINEKKDKILWFNTEKSGTERQIFSIEQKISWYDPEKINLKKSRKLELFNEMESLQKGVNYNVQIPEDLKSLDLKIWTDLESMNELVNQITIQWKSLADQKKLKESQIETAKIKIESQNKNLEIEVKNLQSNIDSTKWQLENVEKRISEINNTINKESQFDCAKINSNCPFVKEINRWTFQELERQKENLEKEKSELVAKLEWFEKQINEKKSQNLGSWENQNISVLSQEIENIDKQMQSLRLFLAQIDFKKIQENWQQWKGLNTESQTLDKEILELENWAKELENFKNEKIKLYQQIENITWNIESLNKEIQNLEDQKAEQQKVLDNFEIRKYEELDKVNKDMERALHEIKVLIDDFKWNSLEIEKLKQDEIMVKNLHQIFSKELLLFVLEWYLPILTDIINALLAQVVDYTIDIKLKQKWENLEMDVKIYDEKWERDIKSLSGWQKVILKLVRMLAISNYIKSPMLFMDETINNLDQDTVWKVAEMLWNFVKQRNVKLYTVTHSQQIQEMDIWDDVVEIK